MLSDLDIGWFLGAYPRFRPNRNAESAADEFERLAMSMIWKIGGTRYTKAKEAFESRHSQATSFTEMTDELADKLEELDFNDCESVVSSSVCSSNAGVSLSQSLSNKQSSEPLTPRSSSSVDEVQDCPGSSLRGISATYPASVNSYFKKFTDFKLDHAKPLAMEFTRLAKQMKWPEKSRTYYVERTECYNRQFQLYFGMATSNLQAWQQLCRDLGIKDVPASVKKCKKSLGNVHVNIYDFIQCKADGRPIAPVFQSKQAFRTRTNNNNGKFPKSIAKQNPFLQVLLKECK